MSDAEVRQLDELLASLPPPLEPLDVSSLDGYLCGIALQPRAIAEQDWLPFVADCDQGRAAPAGPGQRIAALARRRHAELAHAIAARQWFDPWVFEPDEPDRTPHEAVLPWVAGFAAALDRFPLLLSIHDAALIEPLAVVYAAFDPSDLVDADDLLPVIETLEPPADMAEAVEDLVRSVLRIADVSRPQRAADRPPPRRRGPA